MNSLFQIKAIGLFIIAFHKGKYINEKKDRVMVMHIENFTKPLYQVFPKDQWFIFKELILRLYMTFITAFDYGLIGLFLLDNIK